MHIMNLIQIINPSLGESYERNGMKRIVKILPVVCVMMNGALQAADTVEPPSLSNSAGEIRNGIEKNREKLKADREKIKEDAKKIREDRRQLHKDRQELREVRRERREERREHRQERHEKK